MKKWAHKKGVSEGKSGKTLIQRRPISYSSDNYLDRLLSLQKSIGNRAVNDLRNAGTLNEILGYNQLSAEVIKPANAVADRVMDKSSPLETSAKTETKEEKEPEFVIKNCPENIKKLVSQGIGEASELSDKALKALKRDISMSYEEKAFKANFGDVNAEQRKTIISRYEHISNTIGSKEFVCKKKCKGKKKTDLCAQAEITGNRIFICPDFGTSGCAPGVTILHESAHNAGAKKDVDKDEGYPPKQAEDNAYSYEYFAVAAKKGIQAYFEDIKLRPKKEIEIEVPRE